MIFGLIVFIWFNFGVYNDWVIVKLVIVGILFRGEGWMNIVNVFNEVWNMMGLNLIDIFDVVIVFIDGKLNIVVYSVLVVIYIVNVYVFVMGIGNDEDLYNF